MSLRLDPVAARWPISTRRALLHLVLCAGAATGAHAASESVQVAQALNAIQQHLLPPVLVQGEDIPTHTLAERMAELHVPGASVAVIRDGRIDWARGFGVVRKGGPAVTPETLFQAASISKPVTTLDVLHLVHEGRLNLDVDVNQYLTSWKAPANDFTAQAPVTLRRLLTHSAGITVHGFAGYAANAPLPTLVQILNGEPPANNPPIRVDSLPGRQWRYSGGGYEIVNQVLNDVTGVPFTRLMHDVVLQPLGMQHSTYQQPLGPELLKQVATPYHGDGTPIEGGPHVYPEQAAAALWTTPSDLARMAIGVQRALAGSSSVVIPVGTAHGMLAPMYNQQALGFVVGGHTDRKYFTHGGVNDGYISMLVAYERGDGVIIMTSGDNGGQLLNDILRTLARQYQWPDFAPPERTLAVVAPETFDRHVGAYRLGDLETMTFWRDGSQFRVRILGQPSLELFPSSTSEYFMKPVDARVQFEGTDGDTDTAVTLFQNDRVRKAPRMRGMLGQRLLEFSIELEKRFKSQAADTRSEAALRRLIDGLASGHPRYEAMQPGLERITHDELPNLTRSLQGFGALQGVTFKGVAANGADIYTVNFEHAEREFRLTVWPDGRVGFAHFDP